MKLRILFIVLCSVLTIGCVTCTVLYLIADNSEIPISPSDGISSSKPATNSQSFEEWRSSRSAAEAAKKTTAQQAMSTAENTTTKSRTLFTIESCSTTSSRIANTTDRTSTTMPMQTAITLTQEIEDMIYDMVYQRNMVEYYNQLQEQQAKKSYITQLKSEIAGLKDQASDLYVQYQNDLQQLTAKCEAMGMSTSSGYYTAQAKSLEGQYKANLAPISEEIDELEKELAQAEDTVNTPIKQPTKESIWPEYLAELEAYQQKLQSY